MPGGTVVCQQLGLIRSTCGSCACSARKHASCRVQQKWESRHQVCFPPFRTPGEAENLCRVDSTFVEQCSACRGCVAVHHPFPTLAERERERDGRVPRSHFNGGQFLYHSFHPENELQNTERRFVISPQRRSESDTHRACSSSVRCLCLTIVCC